MWYNIDTKDKEKSLKLERVIIMKHWFIVTFRYSENVHCTNLCYADSIEQVEGEYKEYEWFSVRSAEEWEVDSYKRRGMPIINL